MKKWLKVVLGIVVGIAVLLAWPAYKLADELSKGDSEDPLVWEDDIRALEERAAGQFAAGEAVVFVGSSSIRLWDSLKEDMAPIPVIQHGFGGAKLNDVAHYAQRLVNNFSPRAVVVFAGTNDIQPGATKSPEALLKTYQKFIATVRQPNAALPVYFIAITPSVLRWEVWETAQKANELISAWSGAQANLYVIDTGPALLDDTGTPDKRNYIFDGLHLSERGYGIWTSIIKPPLLAELGLSTKE